MAKAQEVIDAITATATVDAHQLPDPLWLVDMEGLLEARNRLDALIAVRLQAGDTRSITTAECGRSTRSWLIEEQHLSRYDATRRLWLARCLPSYPAVADAFTVGRISSEQAMMIISCVSTLTDEWRAPVLAELLGFAADHDPGMLAALIRAVKVRTGVEESAEARAERQYRDRFLNMHDTFEGTVRLDGMLDPASAATIRAALQPLLAGGGGPEDLRTGGQRRADALVALADLSLTVHANPDLTHQAGLTPRPAQLLTTIPFNELRDGITTRQLSAATLNGATITPNTARMLACDAGIIPAVLGGTSEILDLGRSTRTWTTAQRRAAALRDQGCVFPLCQTGLEHCHLHHLHHWANGGPTNHDLSAYLCHFHHWLVHHTTWTITRNTAGIIEVHRT
jgi:hypothetical protein